MEEKLFDDAVVEEVRKKIQSEGLKGVDTKELLVLIADYFNDEVSSIQKMLTDSTSSIQKMLTDSTSNIQKMVHGALGALWAIFGSIIASLIAGLVIALLTLK